MEQSVFHEDPDGTIKKRASSQRDRRVVGRAIGESRALLVGSPLGDSRVRRLTSRVIQLGGGKTPTNAMMKLTHRKGFTWLTSWPPPVFSAAAEFMSALADV